MTSSVSISWTTPVIPKFHNNETDLKLTDNEISWMLAVTSPGMITGSVVARFSSDIYGRRTTLLASAFPFIIGTIFIITAMNAWMLYVARFLWGCGSGIINVVSSIYLAEISDKDIRGKLSVANRFMFNFGILLVLAIGSFVYYVTLSYLLIILPLCYFVACWWAPETPYYLLKEGKVDKARKELLRLDKSANGTDLEAKLASMTSDVKTEMSRSGSLKELFTGKQYRKALIIGIGLRTTQIMSGTIPITQYLGRIMQESNSAISVAAALIIFGFVRFVVGLTSSILVDKVGRRPLLIYTFLSASIFLGIVGAVFFMQEVAGFHIDPSSPINEIVFIGIILFNITSTFGFDTLIFVVPAEIFPLNVKSVAMTFLNILGAVLTFIGVKGYKIVKDFTGLWGVFWCFGVVAFSGAIFSYLVVPETKGKSLREIQIEFQGNIYDNIEKKSNAEALLNNDEKINGVEIKCIDKNSVP